MGNLQIWSNLYLLGQTNPNKGDKEGLKLVKHVKLLISTYLQVQHLKGYECIIEEELIAADDGQVGEEAAEGAQPIDAVQQDVASNLAQLRERQIVILAGVSLVDQHDLQESLNDSAALQLRELVHGVPDVATLAH